MEKTHLRVIRSSGGEQSVQRVVGRDDETSQVNQELAGDVEENEEEVDADQAEDHVDLRDGGLTLQVVEDGVLGQLDNRKNMGVSALLREPFSLANKVEKNTETTS